MQDQDDTQPSRQPDADAQGDDGASLRSTDPRTIEAEPDADTTAAAAQTVETGASSLDAAIPSAPTPETQTKSTQDGNAPRLSWLPMVVPVKAKAATEDDAPGVDEWPAPGPSSQTSAPGKPKWARWLTGRAATIAIAAAIGALAGSMVPAAITRLAATGTDVAAPDPVDALRQSVGQLSAEIRSLQTAVGEAGDAATSGLAALEERLDGAEQGQTELAAKVASLTDGLARQPTPAKAPMVSNETTGSVTPPDPSVAEDWVLWRVQNGRALVQGNGGYFEVAPGSTLPGLGLVQRIMRKDGRWVVVTRNGLIVSRG